MLKEIELKIPEQVSKLDAKDMDISLKKLCSTYKNF